MATHTPPILILQGTKEKQAALTMNSRVRKALFGTKRRLGPFFTMVYLQTGASQSAPQQDANGACMLLWMFRCPEVTQAIITLT